MRAAVAAAVKATAGVAAVVVDADVADGAENGFEVDWTSFEETYAVESATSMVGEVARRRARKELEEPETDKDLRNKHGERLETVTERSKSTLCFSPEAHFN